MLHAVRATLRGTPHHAAPACHNTCLQLIFSFRQLDIDAQMPALYVATKNPTKGLCVYLTLRDADILAPEDMPYVRCAIMTVNNHANRENDIMEGAYARQLHPQRCHWSARSTARAHALTATLNDPFALAPSRSPLVASGATGLQYHV